MKKSVFYKVITGIVLVSAILISSINANAQRRSARDDKYRYEERKKPVRLREYNRKEKCNKSDYRVNRKKSWQNVHIHKKGNSCHKKVHAKHYKHHHKYYKRNQRYRHCGHKYHYPHYKYRRFYNRHGHSCYHHSKYGNVVVRFACDPIIIHHSRGDYYYSEGYYYRFYPEIGFVVVEPPRSHYFSCIPDDCHRVSIQGGVYYSNGDLCFVRHRKGFKLVKAPLGIHLSFKF